MGFFSWKTADTNKSIPNANSVMYDGSPVYLLLPAEGIRIPFRLIQYLEGFDEGVELDYIYENEDNFIEWMLENRKQEIEEFIEGDEDITVEDLDVDDFIDIVDFEGIKEYLKDKFYELTENIEEPAYDGYGIFGGYDAYEILFFLNLDNIKPEVVDLAEELLEEGEQIVREIGIDLASGEVYKMKNENKYLVRSVIAKKLSNVDPNIIPAPFDYEEEIEGLGESLNSLIEKQLVDRIPFRDIVLLNPDQYKPLKFSFNPDAKYEDLPASKECEYQGYFYPEDDYEEEVRQKYRLKP